MLEARPMSDRFWEKVAVADPDECWEWQAGRTYQNYGWFSIARGKARHAHRVAWWLTFGPVPDGLCVLHECDNPPCVNPAHLHLGTKKDNARECVERGRHNSNAPRGTDHPAALLTETDVRTIRRRSSEGELGTVLAKDYGVSHATIMDVVHRRSWRSVA